MSEKGSAKKTLAHYDIIELCEGVGNRYVFIHFPARSVRKAWSMNSTLYDSPDDG